MDHFNVFELTVWIDNNADFLLTHVSLDIDHILELCKSFSMY